MESYCCGRLYHLLGGITVGIYLLNLFLSFLQPKFDPSLEQDQAENEVEAGGPSTGLMADPSGSNDDEFKPFIRRLPEFKFWFVIIIP